MVYRPLNFLLYFLDISQLVTAFCPSNVPVTSPDVTSHNLGEKRKRWSAHVLIFIAEWRTSLCLTRGISKDRRHRRREHVLFLSLSRISNNLIEFCRYYCERNIVVRKRRVLLRQREPLKIRWKRRSILHATSWRRSRAPVITLLTPPGSSPSTMLHRFLLLRLNVTLCFIFI